MYYSVLGQCLEEIYTGYGNLVRAGGRERGEEDTVRYRTSSGYCMFC